MLRVWRGMENVVFEIARWMMAEGLRPEDVIAAYREAGKRHKAGDSAVMPRACPRCGGDVELLELCPRYSPVWRTQLACMADACDWHGKSRLPIDALRARGAAKMNNSVE